MAFDILIKNGQVLDGIKSDPIQADVGISGDEIKSIGSLGDAKAKLVIDAAGKFVTPGFVDVQNHSDSYLTLLDMPEQESMVSQGVTTIVLGQCGTSLAPLARPEAFKSLQKWHALAGANFNWLTFKEFYQTLEKYQLGVNVASLIGHSTVRRGLIGDEARGATPEEISIMSKLIKKSLEEGGAGVSLGLMYAHEAVSSAEELESAAREAALQKKVLSVHLRSDGSHTISAMQEAIGIAKASGARLKISHLKIRGEKNWLFAEEALTTLSRAYEQGVDVSFDVYPYHTSWSVLYTYLPKWAYEGGKTSILRNLRSASTRDRILTYLRDQEHDLGQILIARSDTNPGIVGKTLTQVARDHEASVEQALIQTLIATDTQVVVFDHNLSPKVTDAFLRSPLSMIASDGAGYNFEPVQKARLLAHPRCFGTFPRFLSMARDQKLMSWSEAIKKITSRPAEKLNLPGRGKLLVGFAADVVVFDPGKIESRATYENPYQEPEGIDHVIVNGKIAHSRVKSESKLAGKVIRI